MKIYLDIETIPGQRAGLREEIAATISPPGNMKKPDTIAAWERDEKPAAIEAAYRKTSLEGDRGEVVVIGWAIDDGPALSLWRRHEDGIYGEIGLLKSFFAAIRREIENRPDAAEGAYQFVGHNVRDFDLRFIIQRAVILGVEPTIVLPHNCRPGDWQVYDTMTELAGWGNRISLARLCAALGIASKGSEIGEEIDGSKVWDFVQAGRVEDVAAYCRGDVERVRHVHRRMTFEGGVAEGVIQP